ncbi:MAG TPA: SgcJ/EcaC family oxidoreductase [Blastocatellia bacterium]|nr:SgcJ/EcaC family oxidoreductase [Blastocatellia bacterium]
MRSMLLFVFILAFATQPARPQTKATNAKRQAIEAIAASFQAAWNRHDMEALAALVAEDVDYVTVVGAREWEKGRKEFKDRHAKVHQTMFRNSVLTIKETHIKFIRPDIAIAHVLWETKGDVVPDRKPGEPRAGIFTWVVEKRRGKWLIIASQNTENKTPTAGR